MIQVILSHVGGDREQAVAKTVASADPP